MEDEYNFKGKMESWENTGELEKDSTQDLFKPIIESSEKKEEPIFESSEKKEKSIFESSEKKEKSIFKSNSLFIEKPGFDSGESSNDLSILKSNPLMSSSRNIQSDQYIPSNEHFNRKWDPTMVRSSKCHLKDFIKYDTRKRYLDKYNKFYYRFKIKKASMAQITENFYVFGSHLSPELCFCFVSDSKIYTEIPFIYKVQLDLQGELDNLNSDIYDRYVSEYKQKMGKDFVFKISYINVEMKNENEIELFVYDKRKNLGIKVGLKGNFKAIENYFKYEIKNMRDQLDDKIEVTNADIIISKEDFENNTSVNQSIETFDNFYYMNQKNKQLFKYKKNSKLIIGNSDILVNPNGYSSFDETKEKMSYFKKLEMDNKKYLAVVFRSGIIKLFKVKDSPKDSHQTIAVEINFTERLVSSKNKNKRKNFYEYNPAEFNFNYDKESQISVNFEDGKNLKISPKNIGINSTVELNGENDIESIIKKHLERFFNKREKGLKTKSRYEDEILDSFAIESQSNSILVAISTKFKNGKKPVRIFFLKINLVNSEISIFEESFTRIFKGNLRMNWNLNSNLISNFNEIKTSELITFKNEKYFIYVFMNKCTINKKIGSLSTSIDKNGKLFQYINLNCLKFEFIKEEELEFQEADVKLGYHEKECEAGFLKRRVKEDDESERVVLSSLCERGIFNKLIVKV